jgi:hypothetical protein
MSSTCISNLVQFARLEDGWGAKKEAGEDIGRPEKESRQEAANQGDKTGREKIGQEKISQEKIRGEEEAVIQTRIARSVLIAYFSS